MKKEGSRRGRSSDKKIQKTSETERPRRSKATGEENKTPNVSQRGGRRRNTAERTAPKTDAIQQIKDRLKEEIIRRVAENQGQGFGGRNISRMSQGMPQRSLGNYINLAGRFGMGNNVPTSITRRGQM